MVPTRNSFENFSPYAGFVAGLATLGAGPTVTLLSGISTSDEANVSIARVGVGVYTISVKGFQGPAGVAIGRGNSTLSGVMVACSTGSYSATTGVMSMQFGSMDNAGAYSDQPFTFQIWAY